MQLIENNNHKIIGKDVKLFDYKRGRAYEEFSKCQDINQNIISYLSTNYNFQNKIILESGAGSGKFTSFLANNCSRLLVVERSESLLQINMEKNKNKTNIKFFLSCMEEVKIEEKSLDIIFTGWSLTSLRWHFDVIIPKFKRILKNEGKVISIENAGNDEFCKLMELEDFTHKINQKYYQYGFVPKKEIDTIISFPNKKVFYEAFSNKQEVVLPSLNIQHRVVVFEAEAKNLTFFN